MKPSEYKKPCLRCIKEFTFEDSDACEYTVPVGRIVSSWFRKGLHFNLDVEDPDCYEYCLLSPEELDEYFEIIIKDK